MTLEVYCQVCARPHPELLDQVPDLVKAQFVEEPGLGSPPPFPPPYRFNAQTVTQVDGKPVVSARACTPDPTPDQEGCWSASYLCTRKRKK